MFMLYFQSKKHGIGLQLLTSEKMKVLFNNTGQEQKIKFYAQEPNEVFQ